ncbi:hypothetical protein B1H10_01150 [candidate division KSB1 bacterium 4484_188]|nr:MAG: hypothetical protein B1H10_01150 [candidate division KSB1 bacterium 4484_188]HFE62976.1 hypothetical protein [Caldithrix sp.]
MKHKIPFIFFVTIFVSQLYLSVFAQDFRTQSMGNVDLILNHRENQLDLFHKTGNAAFMMQAEPRAWLKMSGSSMSEQGDLRREYDPHGIHYYQFHAEGIKTLSDKQTFWGKVNYQFQRLSNLPYVLEPQPYGDDPILIADTTIGQMNADGPMVTVRYQYQFTDRFSLGSGLFYHISQAIKKQYTRARVLHRDFAAQLAFAFNFGKNFILGGYYAHQNIQDEIKLKTSIVDGISPLIKRRWSEDVFWRRTGKLTHYDKYFNNRANISFSRANTGSALSHLFQFNYENRTLDGFDKTSKIRSDSDWFEDIYSVEYEGRYRGRQNRWNAGIRLGWEYRSGFNKHPALAILITRRKIQRPSVEAGISRRFRTEKPILLAVQAGFLQERNIYDDYQSQVFRDFRQNQFLLKLGTDWQLNSIHHFLLGINIGDFRQNMYSPRYLPDHTLYRFSVGLSEHRLRYNYLFIFEFYTAENRNRHNSFNGWRLTFYTQIFPK